MLYIRGGKILKTIRLGSMSKTSIYIRSYELSPSGYYRIIQYTRHIEEQCVVHSVLPYTYYKLFLKFKKIKHIKLFILPFTFILMVIRILLFIFSDIFSDTKTVIISRGLLPHYYPLFVKTAFSFLIRKCDLIWDFDDDILSSKEVSVSEFNFLAERSNCIVVTHSYLKDTFLANYAEKTTILPTTDGDFLKYDKNKLLEHRLLSFDYEIRLVWVGTAGNLFFLNLAIESLDIAAQKFFNKTRKKIVLTIVSSQELEYKPRYIIINTVPWNRDIAISEINKSHIGIMPLNESKYVLGKGGFKLVQYMASGLPVIGSNVGFNRNIICDKNGVLITDLNNWQEWYNAIYSIVSDKVIYKSKSQASYEIWETDFSYDRGVLFWKKQLLKYKKDTDENTPNNNIE